MLAAIFVRELSVDSQFIQASVTETPYFNCDKSSGMLWLPSLILDSIITPQIERLPSLIWCVMSSNTSGWTLWSLFEVGVRAVNHDVLQAATSLGPARTERY